MADKRSPHSSAHSDSSVPDAASFNAPARSSVPADSPEAQDYGAGLSADSPSRSETSHSDELERLGRSAGLDRIRGLSYLLDNAIPIPGTGYSFGLDPIIGLLPGGGDIVGTLLSAYIVLEAARFRLSVPTMIRMVFNIVLEMVVGTVPVVGDLFDVGWKANAKNLKLLESHLERPHESRAADQNFFVALVLVLVGLVALQLIWYVAVVKLLVSLFGE